jgi:hypothetical protein
MNSTEARHSLSRPIWVSDETAQGWVLICDCGEWQSPPFEMLKQLKQEGLGHLKAA